MLRLVYVVAISLPLIIFFLFKCNYMVNHSERYTEEERYAVAQKMISLAQKNGRISTEVYGLENLPEEGGYVMYPNHQGKYDALGLISVHKTPCTFVIDEKSSKAILTNDFTNLLDGCRLDKTDAKSQVKTILEIVERVKKGKRIIIFPEGQYGDNTNKVFDFKPGAFKCSVKAKSPIVPVALIDSHKVFGVNSLKRVKTQVHFLKPIYFQEYKDMSTSEIAEMVKVRITDAIAKTGVTA